MTLGELGAALKRDAGGAALYARLCPNDARDGLADLVDALLGELGDAERVRRGFARHPADGGAVHRRWAVRGRAQVRGRAHGREARASALPRARVC